MLILTARGLPDDRIEGLSLGADDYLAKPFEPQELLLRIEAILRRAGPRAPAGRDGSSSAAAASISTAASSSRDGAPVRLTEAEAQLLRRLAQTPTRRSTASTWRASTADATGRAVDVQVTRLRRKIEADPKQPALPADRARRRLHAGARLMSGHARQAGGLRRRSACGCRPRAQAAAADLAVRPLAC